MFYATMKFVKKLNNNGFSVVEIIIVMLAVAVVGLSGYAVYLHGHNHADTAGVSKTTATSTQTSTNNSTKQALNEQIQYIDKLHFAIYNPTFIPQGYVLNSSTPIIPPNSTDQPYQAGYYDFTYISATNATLYPSPYDIYEFAASSSYNPPADCESAQPEILGIGSNYAQPCQLIGHSSLGCDVYYWDPNSTSETTSYCKVGLTQINIDADYGTEGVYPHPDAILHIYNSMQKATAQQLAQSSLKLTGQL